MRPMTHTFLVPLIAAGAAVALAVCPLCGGGRSAAGGAGVRTAHAAAVVMGAGTAIVGGGAAVAQPITVVTLRVAGMTCGGCVLGVRKVLTRLDGVEKAEVSYEKGLAIVTFDSSKMTVAQMVAAIGTLGYTATPTKS